MPVSAKRTYSAVAFTITALCVVFGVAAGLRPLIPPLEDGPLGQAGGDFIRQAAKQKVRWRTLEEEPFREAQRLDRPLCIVGGAAKSSLAREFDRLILSESEVAERLNREFVPVRIDLGARPEWASAILPLTNGAANSDEGWWVVCCEPRGRLLVVISRTSDASKIDQETFLRFLSEARRRKALSLETIDRMPPQSSQIRERALLLDAETAPWTDIGGYAARVANLADSSLGGWSVGGALRPLPWEWRCLIGADAKGVAAAGLTTLSRSGLIDWVYGGVYRIARDPAGSRVAFDRDAVTAADLASALSLVAAQTGDPWLRFVALRLLDSLTPEFVGPNVIYGHAWLEAKDDFARSGVLVRRRVFERSLSVEDRTWMARSLDLDPSRNPTMRPRIVSPPDMLKDPDRVDESLRTLAKIAALEFNYGDADAADTTSWLAARHFECGLWLGEERLLGAGDALMDRARAFRVGIDDVMHARPTGGASSGHLGDYAAFAEAAALSYMVRGDLADLESGTVVLERAMFLFKSGRPGVLLTTPNLAEKDWLQEDAPAIVDGDRPGSMSMALRCAYLYSCLWFGTQRGDTFREFALEAVARLRAAAVAAGFRTGAFHASAMALEGQFWIAVRGDGALIRSRELARKYPGVLVIPMLRPGSGTGTWKMQLGRDPVPIGPSP